MNELMTQTEESRNEREDSSDDGLIQRIKSLFQ